MRQSTLIGIIRALGLIFGPFFLFGVVIAFLVNVATTEEHHNKATVERGLAIGSIAALLWVLGGVFITRWPRLSVGFFLVAGLLLFSTAYTVLPQFSPWGIVPLISASLSFHVDVAE